MNDLITDTLKLSCASCVGVGFFRHRFRENGIGDLESAARFENAEHPLKIFTIDKDPELTKQVYFKTGL